MSIRKSKTLLSLEASVFEMILREKLIKQFGESLGVVQEISLWE